MISDAAQRSVFRWIHIIFAIPIIGYVYSPFEQIPNYAHAVRLFFVPVIVVSGLWMWKGSFVRRLCFRKEMKSVLLAPLSQPVWHLRDHSTKETKAQRSFT